MRTLLLLSLTLNILLISCSSETKTNDAPSIPKQAWTDEAQEEWLLKLSGEMYPQPRSLEEQQQNQIIEYALNQELPIKKLDEGVWLVVHKSEAPNSETLQWGQKIKTHYIGRFLDGKEFDNSYSRGEPLDFYIGNMIHGWNIGLQQLRKGDFATFLVPSRLGYDEEGMKGPNDNVIVPPNTPLRFDIEVID